jgi:glycosyltransferase involved in cell wall biosynthesis
MNESRIHVLEVIGNAIVGGMETWVERFIERMPRERYRFTALCPFESPYTDRLRALDVEVLVSPMPDDPPWSTIQLAAALVSAGSIDLLHAHMPKAHLLAGIVGRLTGKPVLTTIHARQLSMMDLEVHRASGSHMSVVCRQAYFHALGLGVSAGQLSFESNGVDTQAFQPRPRAAGGLRDELGIPADAPLLGFVGRLSPEKGPTVFVRAALLLHSRVPEVHFVMVGDGPLEPELRALAERFGLAGRLHFAGLRRDMAAVYSELDVVVSSSNSEAMPLALMEAMACGLPIVATRVGGVPDLVEHGETGWLVGPGEFDDIAGRCAALADDAALRRRMGERARQRVVERFDLGECVRRMDQLITRLAGSRAEGPRRVTALAAPARRGDQTAGGSVSRSG